MHIEQIGSSSLGLQEWSLERCLQLRARAGVCVCVRVHVRVRVRVRVSVRVRVRVCGQPCVQGLCSSAAFHCMGAGAWGTPWQTQCNEAMPWSGKQFRTLNCVPAGHPKNTLKAVAASLAVSK